MAVPTERSSSAGELLIDPDEPVGTEGSVGCVVKEENDRDSCMAKTLLESLLKSVRAVDTGKDVKTEGRNQNQSCEMEVKSEPFGGGGALCKSPESTDNCASICERTEAKSKDTNISEEVEADRTIHNTDETVDRKNDPQTYPTEEEKRVPCSSVSMTAPKHEELSVLEDGTSQASTLQACVHLPRFHLTAVRPFCLFHERYNCTEYRPGGSCYMTAQRSRILQLRRNLAIRSGRLPPLPARHQHSARTYGRVRPKPARPRQMADTCVAVLPLPDGSPLPLARLPPAKPAPRRFSLPDNVPVSEVCEVVLLTPVRSEEGSSCHGVRLASGALIRVGPGAVRAGVSCHMQPADDVIITAADGRRFRNLLDRGCTDLVDVEKPEGKVTRFPLVQLNRSIAQGQLLLTGGTDGGLTLSPSRVRVMCRDRLRRVVAVGQRGRWEVFGTGTAVAVVDDAGQLTLLGALPPEMTPKSGSESKSRVDGATQPVQDASGEPGNRPASDPSPSASNDDNDELQVIGTVQGGSKERQRTTGTKETGDGDAGSAARKRRLEPGVRNSRSEPKSSDEMKQRKALLASAQPRSSDGKFLPAAKRVAKTPAAAPAPTKNVDEPSVESERIVVVPAKKARMMCTVPSPVAQELPSTLTPSWVMSRLHSVTVEVVPSSDELEVTRKSPESSVKTAPPVSKRSRSVPATDKSLKTLSATGVLMSVVQKLASNGTKSTNSSSSITKEPATSKLVIL